MTGGGLEDGRLQGHPERSEGSRFIYKLPLTVKKMSHNNFSIQATFWWGPTSMFIQEKFRKKIRDYLLFLISSGIEKQELQNKCQWSERRLARFLADSEISDKQLSITLKDLYHLSRLERDNGLGNFVNHLNSETSPSENELIGWQKKCLTIFESLTQDERYSFLIKIFNQNSDTERSARFFQIISHMANLSAYELETISRVVKSFAA